MKVLVTGVAGFIGFHVAKRLLERGEEVVGIDNLNNYYQVGLKKARLALILPHQTFRFVRLDITNRQAIEGLFRERFDAVVHLAAQAGVQHSIENPHAYVDANVTGFLHVLEGCRQSGVEHLVYASSSSVYGTNTRMPFSEMDDATHPLTIYAATKRANELMAHSYSQLHGLPTTGLRFFSVYGPWGRPDSALFKFTKCIIEGRPIEVYNYGRHKRDFTYIDEAADAVLRILDHSATSEATPDGARPDLATIAAPFRLYNVGSNQPVDLMAFIKLLERCLGRKAHKIALPMKAGDLPGTNADISALDQAIGRLAKIPLEEGVARFVEWYLEIYEPLQKSWTRELGRRQFSLADRH